MMAVLCQNASKRQARGSWYCASGLMNCNCRWRYSDDEILMLFVASRYLGARLLGTRLHQ